MSKTNKQENTNVDKELEVEEVENQNLPNDLKWDDLIELYKKNNELVQDGIAILTQIGTSFQEVINMDKELSTTYIGATNTFLDLIKELTKILAAHSKKTEVKVEGGEPKIQLNPYIGNVQVDNDDHREVYLQLVMAYTAFTEKATSAIENVLTTLTGMVQEVAEKNGIEEIKGLDEITKTDDTKGENNEQPKSESK